MIRGWGSFWQVQLPKGPCATYVGGRWCVRQHMGLLCCAPACLTVLLPKEMLLRAGIAESAFKFFAEDTNNHSKLQECDFFPSLLSLCYDVLWWTLWGRSVESPWIEASALKISSRTVFPELWGEKIVQFYLQTLPLGSSWIILFITLLLYNQYSFHKSITYGMYQYAQVKMTHS